MLSAVDLLPTFCELAGKELPKAYQPDGESFASIFRNIPFERSKPLFWDWHFPYAGDDPHRANSWVSMAVRDGEWKLLADEKRERVELYNIAEDTFEKQNRAVTNSEKATELMAMWEEWKRGLPE